MSDYRDLFIRVIFFFIKFIHRLDQITASFLNTFISIRLSWPMLTLVIIIVGICLSYCSSTVSTLINDSSLVFKYSALRIPDYVFYSTMSLSLMHGGLLVPDDIITSVVTCSTSDCHDLIQIFLIIVNLKKN